MDVSGRPNEGWISVIPLTVLVFIVLYTFGGPAPFVTTVIQWAADLQDLVTGWLNAL